MTRSTFSSSERFCHQDVDHVPIFSMNHGEQIIFSTDPHDLEDITVIQPQSAVISGENLHAGDTQSGQVRKFFSDLFVEMSDVHVKTVIDAGFWVRHGTMPRDIFCEADRLL